MKFTGKRVVVALAVVGTLVTGGAYANDQVATSTAMVGETMVGMPSPIREYNSLPIALRDVGFLPPLPATLLPGYTVTGITTISNEVVQMHMNPRVSGPNSPQEITYRVARGSEDISGDYNKYKMKKTKKVDGMKVTFKGDKKMVSLATWTNQGYTFSYHFGKPVTMEEAESLVHGTTVNQVSIQESIQSTLSQMAAAEAAAQAQADRVAANTSGVSGTSNAH